MMCRDTQKKTGSCMDDLFKSFEIYNTERFAWQQVDAMKMIENESIIEPVACRKRASPPTVAISMCKYCNNELNIHDTTCRKCAIVQDISPLTMPTKEEMIYKHQTHSIPCAYKRINHFNEKLAQFQGKEKTTIPDLVYEVIREEITMSDSSIDDVAPVDIKYILKKRSLSKYYEHINYITRRVNGYELPSLMQSDEERLRKMFSMIQSPFSKYAPIHRKNFLNYAYIFRKFFELLSYDRLIKHFSELKSREKLYEQDKIWRLICADLNWEYIPSI